MYTHKFFKFFQKIFPKLKYSFKFILYDQQRRAPERGEDVKAVDRRRELLEVLCLRRYDTCENLAHEFHVSKRTIYSDIEVLMCSYPIEAVRGHGGGFKMADGYYLYCNSHCKAVGRTLNTAQVDLLQKVGAQLDGSDLNVLNSILLQFSPQ